MNDLDQYSTLTELKQMFKDMNADAVFVFNYKTKFEKYAIKKKKKKTIKMTSNFITQG